MECFTWICPGDITQLDYKKNVNNTIKHTKDRVKSKPLKNAQIKPEYIEGYGTYFYPPIWLDKKPQLTLKDKIFGSRMRSKNNDSLNLEYKGRILIIEKDGFIGIGEEDKDRAILLLNEIMAIFQFFDYPFHYIRENEVGRISINPLTLTIQSVQLQGPNKRTDLFDDRWRDISEIPVYIREEVPKKNYFL